MGPLSCQVTSGRSGVVAAPFGQGLAHPFATVPTQLVELYVQCSAFVGI